MLGKREPGVSCDFRGYLHSAFCSDYVCNIWCSIFSGNCSCLIWIGISSILADLVPTFHSYVSSIQCLLCNIPWYAGNSLLWFSWLFFNEMCENSGHWPSMWVSLINAHYILSHMFPLHFSSCITEMSNASQSDLGLFSCLSAGLVECNCTNHCLLI